MGTVTSLLEKLRTVNLRAEVPAIIERTSYNIVGLNQSQLFDHSIDSEGVPLRLYASIPYAVDKTKRNPRPGLGRPDLFLTGAFYKGFEVKVDQNTFVVSSTDSKSSKLVEKYGDDIFGLTKENTAIYARETVYTGIQRYLSGVTGLRIRGV